MNLKLKIALLLAALTLVAFTCGFLSATAILTTQKQVSVGVRVVTTVELGVYPNSSSAEELVTLNLDTILPSQTIIWNIWIENKAEIDMNISITTQDWSPYYAEGNMTFTSEKGDGWQPYEEYPILRAGYRRGFKLSLTASESWITSEDVAFTIVIRGDSV